jgi:hypothetical protein
VEAAFKTVFDAGALKTLRTIVLDIHGEETRSILDHADMQTPESFREFIRGAFRILKPYAVRVI